MSSTRLLEAVDHLVESDVRQRSRGVLLLIQGLIEAEAVSLLVTVPRRESHQLVASVGYDDSTLDFLASPSFTVKCDGTKKQLASDSTLLDWYDLPGHADSFAPQEVLIPKGFRNGLTLPLHEEGELVGALHVNTARSRLLPSDKMTVWQLRPALTKLASAVRRSAAPSLTRRELEILELLKQGMTNLEIAKELYLSSRTVSTHVEHILRKLNCSSRAAAAAWAATHHVERRSAAVSA